MVTSEKQKIYNVKVPKGGYGYYTLYRGIYDPSNNIDERPAYAETGDLFEPYNSSVVYKATRSGGKTTWAIDESAKRQSETGEGGGSSLPSMTGKNGKVLGVTLDAQDHEQAEWITPSGGGGSAEKFTATFTEDGNGGVTCDKTIAQIVAAKAAGKDVVGELVINDMPAGLTFEIGCEYATEVTVEDTEMEVCQFSGVIDLDGSAVVAVTGYAVGGEDAWSYDNKGVKDELPSYNSSYEGYALTVSGNSVAWSPIKVSVEVTLDSDVAGGYKSPNLSFARVRQLYEDNGSVRIEFSDDNGQTETIGSVIGVSYASGLSTIYFIWGGNVITAASVSSDNDLFAFTVS